MHVRCPHCRNAIDIVAEQTLNDIACPSCGSHFQLLTDGSTKSYRHEDTTRVSQFELLELVGMGKYGAVWKARDTELDRVVAIKIPRAENLTSAEAEQFVREARAAAQVKHSNIVSVLEVGRHDGTLYIVSDFVDGVNLQQWLSTHQPTFKEAAHIAATIADALHQAHQAGVIHRDLKPSNILIDGRGEPFVVDFGLAKREVGEITITLDGRVLGTPAYMPPEQASGRGHHADRRADVYSLGVVLFELLTGEPPFRGEQRMLIVQILNDEPPSPRQLNARIPRDLATICLKCLEKKPESRYPTAAELRDDLQRFLRGESIHARPVSTISRGLRWCRRNPAVAGLLSLVFLVLATGMAVSTYFAWESQRQAQRADAQAARLAITLYESLLSQIQVTREARLQGYRPAVYELAAKARQLDTPAYSADELRQEIVAAMGDFVGYPPTVFEDFPAPVTAVALDPEGRQVAIGFDNGAIWIRKLSGTDQQWEVRQHTERVLFLRFSQDGHQLTSADRGGIVQQWELSGDAPQSAFSFQLDRPVKFYGRSVNDQLLVALSEDHVDIWNLASRERVHSIPGPGLTFRNAALSPDNTMLATGYSETMADRWGLAIWKVDSGEKLMQTSLGLGQTYSNAIAFSRDGRFLAIGFDEAQVVYDAAELQQLAIRRWDATKAIAFDPRTQYLAAVDIRGRILLWNPLTGQDLASLHNWRQAISREALSFSADGSMLASSNAHRVQVWNLDAAREKQTLAGHNGGIPCLAFSHGGAWLASCGKDRMVRLWDAVQGTLIQQYEQPAVVQTVSFSPDDRLLAVGSWEEPGEGLQIIDRASGRLAASVAHGLQRINCLQFFERGGLLYLAGCGDRGLAIWTVSVGATPNAIDLQQQMHLEASRCLYLAVSPDGRWIVWVSDDRHINLWDVARQEARAITAPEMNQGWHGLSFFPDSRRFIFISEGGIAQVWDIEAKSTMQIGRSGQFHAPHLALSRNAKLFAGLTGSEQVSVWRTETESKLFAFRSEGSAVWSLAWSPDANRLAVGLTDGRIVLWNLLMVRQELAKMGLAW